MRMLAAIVAAALILSSTLVFGVPSQLGACVSPRLTAQHTAPTAPAPVPKHLSAAIPKKHYHRCKLKLQLNGRSIPVTVPISEPNTPLILGPGQIKSCAAIQTDCPNLVVAVPTQGGGICCQNGKNRSHLCSGLDLRFLRGPEWKLRLITTPLSTSGMPR